MRRFLQWAGRFDRLECVTAPRSGHLFVSYRAGLKRVLQVVLLASALGWGVVASVLGIPNSIAIAIGGGIVLVFVLTVGPRRIRLGDRTLVQAAGRAALELGVEHAPGWWRISGPEAGAVARELSLLSRMPWPLPVGGDREQAREAQLIAAAGPELQPYLRPILTAGEGYEPEVVASEPAPEGEIWPLLDTRPPQRGPHPQA